MIKRRKKDLEQAISHERFLKLLERHSRSYAALQRLNYFPVGVVLNRRSLFAREISSIYLPISSNCLFR